MTVRLAWLVVAGLLAFAAVHADAPRKIILRDTDALYCVEYDGNLSCAPLATVKARLLASDCSDTR